MASAYPSIAAGESVPARIMVPRAAALVAGFRAVMWLSPDGEIEALSVDEARRRLDGETAMVCHARATARRLAVALGLAAPESMAEACVALTTAARALLQELGQETDPNARAIAEIADRAGWAWGPAVLAALPATDQRRAVGLRAWQALDEWQERAPPPPPGNEPVGADEARGRLAA